MSSVGTCGFYTRLNSHYRAVSAWSVPSAVKALATGTIFPFAKTFTLSVLYCSPARQIGRVKKQLKLH